VIDWVFREAFPAKLPRPAASRAIVGALCIACWWCLQTNIISGA
jgi:hypothetical protein